MSSLIIAAWTRVNGVTWAHHTLLSTIHIGRGKQEQGTSYLWTARVCVHTGNADCEDTTYIRASKIMMNN